MKCFGCQLANGTLPASVVYEDERVSCILDIAPFNEGHVLILPKNHANYFTDFGAAQTESVMNATKLLTQAIRDVFNPDGVTVCQNGGAGDSLGHFHLHVVPIYKGQDFSTFWRVDLETQSLSRETLEKTKLKLVTAINKLRC